MPEGNIDDYRIEQYIMKFVGYTTSSVTNPNPVEGESRTLCSGTAQVEYVRNFHLSKITWDCVSASLKNFFFDRLICVRVVRRMSSTSCHPTSPYGDFLQLNGVL